MRFAISLLVLLFLTVSFGGSAFALQDASDSITDTVMNGCKKELKSYCGKVTPGNGRVLACLYSYEDKLSGRCEYALYDAAVQLERAIGKLTYLINECIVDFNEYCSNVKIGEGRILTCLEKNEAKVSKRCLFAIEEVMPAD